MVNKEHVVQAIQREYQKMGKALKEHEIGSYLQ